MIGRGPGMLLRRPDKDIVIILLSAQNRSLSRLSGTSVYILDHEDHICVTPCDFIEFIRPRKELNGAPGRPQLVHVVREEP